MDICIIDSMPGSGKTQWAITRMRESSTPVMYITPLLSEVQRIKQALPQRRFYEPLPRSNGAKYANFEQLVMQGCNIASTHSLFTNTQPDILDYVHGNNYTLILDEVLEVVETYTMSCKDWDVLYDRYFIVEPATHRIIWIDNEYTGKHEDIMRLAKSNSLYLHSRSHDDSVVKLLVWTFPQEVFAAFEHVYILTYLFNGSLLKCYFDLYNLPWENINTAGMGKWYTDTTPNVVKQKVHVYDGSLNNIGNIENALSKTWLDKALRNGNIELLKNNIYNYFFNITHTPSKHNMWTTIKGNDGKRDAIRLALSGKGYARGFVPCNTRATNDYGHKTAMAYCLNRYMHPMDMAFFTDKGIHVNEDMWALTELVQWVFRGSVRNGENVQLYLPAQRMRNLWQNWQ